MKQGLSLRVSQHLALTPQLQQSIRLLQLSTLKMAQEVEQMLDENPFLERDTDTAEREDFGLEQTDAPVSLGDQVAEWSPESPSTTTADTSPDVSEDHTTTEPSWDGDGTVELRADDSEWGGDAPARNGARDDDETASAADLASEHLTLQAHLHQQALSLRLNDDERAALYYLIESLNDDGYLADPIDELAEALLAQEERVIPLKSGVGHVRVSRSKRGGNKRIWIAS